MTSSIEHSPAEVPGCEQVFGSDYAATSNQNSPAYLGPR
jgi:hypothetical protein